MSLPIVTWPSPTARRFFRALLISTFALPFGATVVAEEEYKPWSLSTTLSHTKQNYVDEEASANRLSFTGAYSLKQ